VHARPPHIVAPLELPELLPPELLLLELEPVPPLELLLDELPATPELLLPEPEAAPLELLLPPIPELLLPLTPELLTPPELPLPALVTSDDASASPTVAFASVSAAPPHRTLRAVRAVSPIIENKRERMTTSLSARCPSW
jgi:hypothetical protein